MFAYIWEYRIRAERVEEFEKLYGAAGEWVELFRRGSGYVGTDLHRDGNDPLRFVTMDRWRSRREFESFREEYTAEFERLDLAGEALTSSESFLGEFELELGDPVAPSEGSGALGALIAARDEAGFAGLCGAGRWEVALEALRKAWAEDGGDGAD